MSRSAEPSRDPPNGSTPPLAGESATHRGIRWHRDPAGHVSWFYEGGNRWVRWRPGSDAPPRPPGWEAALPSPLSSGRRPSWRTGYRLFPVLLVVFILVVGALQALRSGPNSQAKDEARAAQKLLGQCLAQKGTVDGHPSYQAKAVACTSAAASVRVVQVLPGTPGSPSCRAGTTAVQLAYPGVAQPHVECTQPVRPGG